MNIFAVDPDPAISARALDDLRLNKMILETAQILSTALRCRHTSMDVYKATHINHPCCIWARENKGNYSWLYRHFVHLVDEKYYRTGKVHKSAQYALKFADGVKIMPDGTQTPFANCTPHKDMEVHEAYKLTLTEKWANDKRPPKWTKREKLF